jgi:Family of unknown function (DUF5947)
MPPSANKPFAMLRQFVKPKAPIERCELCGAALAPEHQHMIELAKRRLVCSCQACSVLFNGQQTARYRLVPQSVRFLPEFRMTEAQWEDLHVPINLAFFFHDSVANRIIAMYPSPAGAIESLLRLEAWRELERENPFLRNLEADVEALLVYRVGAVHACYLAPIDECYKLVGLIRAHWQGLSGGTEVWREIGRFFTELKDKSSPMEGAAHA